MARRIIAALFSAAAGQSPELANRWSTCSSAVDTWLPAWASPIAQALPGKHRPDRLLAQLASSLACRRWQNDSVWGALADEDWVDDSLRANTEAELLAAAMERASTASPAEQHAAVARSCDRRCRRARLKRTCSTRHFAQTHCAGTCCREFPKSRRAFFDGSCTSVPRFDPSAQADCTKAPPPFRVLYVSAVGVSYSGLVSDAVSKLVALPYVDVFLIHYDRGGIVTYREGHAGDGLYTYLPWYAKVRFATTFNDNVTGGTSKPQHVRRELILDAAMRATVTRDYSHVWVADENIAFPQLRLLDAFLRAVNASGAAIAQPAIKGSIHPMLSPAHCAVRSTDFVEVMLPIMRTCVFEHVYTHLLVGQRTDWGLDKLWCRYFARFEPWKSRRRGGGDAGSGACKVITSGRFVKVWDHARKRNESAYSRQVAHTEAACIGHFFAHLQSQCHSFCCADTNDPQCGRLPARSFSRLDPQRQLCVEKGSVGARSALLGTSVVQRRRGHGRGRGSRGRSVGRGRRSLRAA